MVNSDHIFTIMDVFYRKYPIDNMRTLIDRCADKTQVSFLNTKLTLGDVALNMSAEDAWWCTQVLPESARKDVIHATIPSLRRAIERRDAVYAKLSKTKRQPLLINEVCVDETILLIEKFLKGEEVSSDQFQTAVINCVLIEQQTSLNEFVGFLACACYMENFSDNIMRAMSVREHLHFIQTEIENDQQINDICVVFTPLIGVRPKPFCLQIKSE